MLKILQKIKMSIKIFILFISSIYFLLAHFKNQVNLKDKLIDRPRSFFYKKGDVKSGDISKNKQKTEKQNKVNDYDKK